MRHPEGWLGASDGTRLYWQAWLPDHEPTAVAVIVHGVGEHGARYAVLGERLTGAGVAAYALDHRGHGRSDGSRAYVDRLDLLAGDLAQFVGRVVPTHDTDPFLIGHSLGGAVSIAYALRPQTSLAGLILSGPAVATEAVSTATIAVSRVMSTLMPHLPVFKLDESLISRDPAVVRAYREDPLVYPGKLPARTLWQILHAMRTLPAQVAGLQMPILLLHGGSDQLCPPSASQMIFERAGTADRTLKVYPDLYHEVFNEPEREQVIADLITWLTEHGSADPKSNGEHAAAIAVQV